MDLFFDESCESEENKEMACDYETDGDFLVNKKSLILFGNKHNVPYVGFSPDGEFICMNSVDSRPKIYETCSGKIVAVLENKGLMEM